MNRIKHRIKPIFVIGLIAVFVLVGGKYLAKTLFPAPHIMEVKDAAAEYSVDPYLVFALVKAESNFVSDAQSHKGAVGLMQITEPTAQWIAEKIGLQNYSFAQVKDPAVNIRMGTWYLSYLLSLYNQDEKLALCAYNAGHGNVDQWLENENYSADGNTLQNIPFPETEKYIQKIETYKTIYKKIYPVL